VKLRDITKYRVIERYLPHRSRQAQRIDSSSLTPTSTNSKNELDYYHFDVTKPPEISDYIENRFLPIFRQYKNNARINTRRLRIWRVSIIVLTMFMIIFNIIAISGNNSNSPSNKSSSIIAMGIVSSIAAALVLGFTAFLQLTKSQENWLLYSTISEKLEREYNLFKFKGGPYSISANNEKEGESADVNKINKLFVEVVENIISTRGSDPRPTYSPTITTDTPTNHRKPTSPATTTAQV
jgi:Protein of unknown function (DUF4231)